MGPRRRKRPRRDDPRATCDLLVVLPKKCGDVPQKLVVRQLLDRLESTGYTHVALTHTVYGRPRLPEDGAETVFPDSYLQQQGPFQVIRRLHAVVENLSDVGKYILQAGEDASSVFDGYELVSISPRNEVTFQAACSSATAAEIITLDYTSGRGGVQLPFKIRTTDVKAAIDRKAVFEIPYTPAILNRNQRKALIQTCRELQMASIGLKPKILLSSGDRSEADSDVGAMALRTPSDLINLAETVLHFDSRMAHDALRATGTFVMERGRQRRFGDSLVTDVYLDDGAMTKKHATSKEETSLDDQMAKIGSSKPLASAPEGQENEESKDELDDGFISL